jgi:hypothetical protein
VERNTEFAYCYWVFELCTVAGVLIILIRIRSKMNVPKRCLRTFLRRSGRLFVRPQSGAQTAALSAGGFQFRANLEQGCLEVGTNVLQAEDDADTDDCSNKTVFDGRCARFVSKKSLNRLSRYFISVYPS